MVGAIEDSILQTHASNAVSSTMSPFSMQQPMVSNGYPRPPTAPEHRRNPSEPPPRSASLDHNPKDELHLNTGSSTKTNNVDPLMLRFSQLRIPHAKPPYPLEDSSSPAFVGQSRPTSRDGLAALAQTKSAPSIPESRPGGPRPMPMISKNGPAPPPKIPISSLINTDLPRAPSPTYSPARNIGAPTHVTPPRSTARSLAGQGSRESQLPNGGHSTNGSFYSLSNEPNKSRPSELPDTTRISAQELFDRFRSHQVLVIDVRPRDHFDSGHIWHYSIMCVEPLSLQYGMSFEDLQDRSLYSPQSEIELFDRIQDFDLVVYHDQDTSTDQFLDDSPKSTSAPWLRALYEILVTFNDRYSLRRSPAVLIGGIDAWTDLVGPQALQTSKTLQVSHPLPVPKPSRRLPHRPSITGGTSSREIRMRRLHQYDPLDAKEKREWQEKVRREEVKPADLSQFQVQPEPDQNGAEEDTVSPQYHRSIDDFLRRYPEEPSAPTSMMKPIQEVPTAYPLAMPSPPTIVSRPAPAVSRPSYSGVSDRQASQSSLTARQPNANQTPLWTPRLISPSYKLPYTGLINFGVTCYMNATVQCLSATIDLSVWFLNERWRNYVQSKNWKGSHGIMPDIFAGLLRSLWQNPPGIPSPVRPKSLRSFCARLNPEWGADRQQDAKEFLEFLIDTLHEDLNVYWNRTALQALTTEQEIQRERMPMNKVSVIEWSRYSHREKSFISDLFAGQHASRLTCATCRNTSTTYEAFYSISVEIPRSGQTKLADCLQSYCKMEMLDRGEEWNCPVCKCQREASKMIRITRLPRILVVHFKRFSAGASGTTRKVHTAVDFPLYGLDMGPYMINTQLKSGDPQQQQQQQQHQADPAITPPFLYDAYAVMRHIGNTLNGGHYISLVRDAVRGVWRRFDDERVGDFDPNRMKAADRLQNEQAYIVFYERSRAR